MTNNNPALPPEFAEQLREPQPEAAKVEALDDVQVVDIGAVVHLDDAALEHGILVMRDGMSAFKLYFKVDEEGQVVGFHPERLVADGPHIKRYFFRDPRKVQPKPEILLPNTKLILPDDGR